MTPDRCRAHRIRPAWLVLALSALVVVGWLTTGRVAGHPELVRAYPPPDGLLAAPPQRLDLWLSEAVDVGAGSPALRLLDERGRDVTVRDVEVDPADATHVRAEVAGVGVGTTTVVWSARSAVDGHTLSGTYAFRAGTGRAPGAATVEGERPPAWAVATRWLTFLGAAVAAGGFLATRVIFVGGDRTPRRRRTAIALGAGVAFLATLAEPVLQTRWPPAGTLAPTLAEAFRGLPSAWWLRPAALAATFLLAVGFVVWDARWARTPAAEWIGLALALTAVLGLSLTSHAAARMEWRTLAMGSNILHQWAVALWVGGLAHLVLGWRAVGRLAPVGASPPTDPLRRFSRLALGLVVIGVGTGVLNAGLVLPTLRSLWTSAYGGVLLLKLGLLVPVLALAGVHRVALRRAVERIGGWMARTVRAEAALVLVVVLGGSVLALLAPPVVRVPVPLDLPMPVAEESLAVHLLLRPAEPGENTVTVRLTDGAGAAVPAEQVALVRLDFTSLDHAVEQTAIAAEPDGEGGFRVEGAHLSVDGWWRVTATVRRLGHPDLQAVVYLVLPDPNLNGLDAGPVPPPSAQAWAVFERGLENMTSLQSVRFTQYLSGGTGAAVVMELTITTGGNGRPPATTLESDQVAIVRIGDREWLRLANDTWTERVASPFVPLSEWGEEFEGATGFRLGRVEEIGGEPFQVVTFFVPGTPQLAPAWYAWWVGLESGRVHRLAMVSRWHYMVKTYRDFDATIVVEPPE